MTCEAKLEAKIKGLGEIYQKDVPFDKALKALKSKKAEIISLRDLVYARMQEESKNTLCQYGSYVKEGDIYVPNQKGVILTRNSLILKSPEQAIQAKGDRIEFHIDKKQALKYLEKAKDQKDNLVILLTDFNSIPTNRFGNDKLTTWLFEDQAKDYGLFLKENGINEMPLFFNDQDYINKQKSPYANQLWLGCLLGRYNLRGNLGGLFLFYNQKVRGVFKE